MNNIGIKLLGNAKVYGSADELYKGLRHIAPNTRPFINAISEFLEEFNKKYHTEVSFNQVLDIYSPGNLGVNQSIILCKALLEFIQNNGIEVSFHGKSHILKYSTLASVNATLEANPLSENERKTLETLSITISSFIQKIRDYFRIIIDDNVDLTDANVDGYFMDLPGFKRLSETVQVSKGNGKPPEELKITPSSVKICEGLTLDCNLSDTKFANSILALDNKQLIAFFEYVYARIPNNKRGLFKHTDIAKLIFDDYQASLGQTINRVFKDGAVIRRSTVDKINIKKLKKFLYSDSVEGNGKPDDLEKNEIILIGNKLHISTGVELDLETDETLVNGLVNLSGDNVQKLFGYLENLIKTEYNIKGSVTRKLVSIIQLSEKRNLNVSQKISSLRNKASQITQKFLDSNINISEFRKLLLINSGVDSGSEPDNLPEQPKNTFEFSFTDNESESIEELKACFQVELNGNKDLKGFIYSLNSLIAQECKRVGLDGCIDTFTGDDFNGIELNTAFFDNVHKAFEGSTILDMFELIDQEVLEKFLNIWHNKVGKKLIEPKKEYIKSGSKEELFDFVFNVWQNALFKKADKLTRKSRRNHNQQNERRDNVRLTQEMFAGVDKLTPDLITKMNTKLLPNGILTDINKKDLEQMIRKYLDERRKLGK